MEEKIIDGVDVKRCKHYDIDNNFCDQSYLGEGGLLKNTKNPKRCEQSPNCYYKQLKRLEEKYNKMVEISKENLIKYEDLRLDNQRLIMEIEGLNSQIDFEAQKQVVLLQENEELKDRVKGEIHLGNNYKKDFADQVQIAEKYKTALEEIKAELKEDLTCESRECGCDDYGVCLECLKETILNIITEAIGDSDENNKILL